MNLKKILLPLLTALLILYMLLFPADALTGSKAGLLLWFHTVLPTLLPFMILSNILLSTGVLEHIPQIFYKVFHILFGLSPYGCYGLLLGLFCGYPMGAKITADLYRMGKINQLEAEYLLTFSNNPSPMFLLTYVIQEQLGQPENAGKIFVILYGAVLLTSLFFRFRYRSISTLIQKTKKETTNTIPPAGELIDVSVMNGFETITRLGGYIILCSILLTAIQKIPGELQLLKTLLESSAELSTGIYAIAQNNYPAFTQLFYTLCGASFGGFCVLLQTNSTLKGTNLSLLPYLKGKLLQTILTGVLVLLIF